MTTTDLGSGFRGTSPGRDELVFQSDVDKIVEKAMREAERRLESLVKALVPKEPPTPQVHVAAPTVTVNPDITVPQIDSPEVAVTVEIPGMDKIETLLAKILTELKKPVVRNVLRDNEGLIQSVRDTR